MASRIIRNVVSALAITGIGIGAAMVLHSWPAGLIIGAAIALIWSLFAFAA